MIFLRGIKIFTEKLRGLSNDHKKIIIVVIVSIVSIILTFFWVKSTAYHLSKIKEGSGSLTLLRDEISNEVSVLFKRMGVTVDNVESDFSVSQFIQWTVDSYEINKENWKMYLSYDYHYEVQYPEDWLIDDSDPAEIIIYPAMTGNEEKINPQDIDVRVYAEEINPEDSLSQKVQERVGIDRGEIDGFQETIVNEDVQVLIVCRNPFPQHLEEFVLNYCQIFEAFILKEGYFYHIASTFNQQHALPEHIAISYHIIYTFTFN